MSVQETEVSFLPPAGGAAAFVDGGLLFSGNYSRDGEDLVISNGDLSARFAEYFSADDPLPLRSPDGALLRGETVELLAGPRAPGQYAQLDPATGAEAIGKVGQITGSASVQHADGTSGQLDLDSSLFQGDIIRTEADGSVGMLFEDGTVLLLQPSSRIVINEYVYDVNSTSNSAVLDVVDGTFAFVAGKVAKTGGLDVTTPIATMGIRGTTGLCVALDSAGARCSLAPDPNFEIGRIDIRDNVTGAVFTTLTGIDVKIALLSGTLRLVEKTDQEIVFDELLTQQLHALYGNLDVPQSGPLQKIKYDGEHDFTVPVPGIGRVDFAALPLLIETQLDLSANIEEDTVNASLGGPLAGSTTIGDLDEAGLDVGLTPLTGTLQFGSGQGSAVSVDFASLDGRPVVDANGNQVTAGNVPLQFSWSAASNTLFASAGNLVVFRVTLDPHTGQYSVLLLEALDHPLAGVADLLTIGLDFTVTEEHGRTATGNLSIRFTDDLPEISIDHESTQTDENQNVDGNWTVVPGADGLASIIVSAGSSQSVLSLADPDNQIAIHLAEGTLVVRADGTWTFEANSNLDNRVAQEVTFTLTATDGDGDATGAIVHIAVVDGAAPTANGQGPALFLDEKALDLMDIVVGDDIGSQPELPTDRSSGTTSFTAGSDDLIMFGLDASNAVVLDEEGHPITVTWIGTGTGILIGQVNDIDAIRIEVTPTVIEAFSSGEIPVTAQLLDNFRHAADGADAIRITGLTVIAADVDGSTAAVGFTVAIADDSASISVGDTQAEVAEGGLVTGQWNLVAGADGVSEISVSVSFSGATQLLDLGNSLNRVVFTSPQGLLTVQANGTWSFLAAANLDNRQLPSNTFTLTVRDGDDDTAAVTDTQSIQVTDGTVAPKGNTFPAIMLDETNLGTSASSTVQFKAGSDDLSSFVFLISTLAILDENLNPLEVNWSGEGTDQLVGRIGNVEVIQLTLFASTISAFASGNVTVTAQLLSNFPHAHGGSGQVTISGISIVGSEGDGDNARGSLTIRIADDAPVAHADTDEVAQNKFSPEIGNVITAAATTSAGVDVPGGDGASVVGVVAGDTDADLDNTGTVGVIIQGAYGKLTVNANGSYSYLRDAGSPGGVSDVFTYTLRDGDGDRSHATLTIVIGDSAPGLGIPPPGGPTTTVDEASLGARDGELAGSDAAADGETVAGTIAFTSPDGVSLVSLGGHVLSGTMQTFTDATGSLTASYFYNASTGSGTISYVYTLLDNTSGDNSQVSFEIVVQDTDGDLAPAGNLVIAIVDDAPVAQAGSALTVAETSGETAGTNLLANDLVGADAARLTAVDLRDGKGFQVIAAVGPTALTSAAGIYVFSADGSWTFDPAVDASSSNTAANFTYRIEDSDGDRAIASQVVTVIHINDPPMVMHTQNWMSSDPSQQAAALTGYPDGYPLYVNIPSDANAGDTLTVTATTVQSGVYYFNSSSSSYVQVTSSTVLFNSATGLNLLDDLVYRPTEAATDVMNTALILDVYDGTAHVTQNIGIHEVAPNSLPTDVQQIGNGSSPLNSGHSQTATLALSQATVNGITSDPHNSTIVVYTDFQEQSNAIPIPVEERDPGAFNDGSVGSNREQEVQVEIVIGTDRFAIVESDLTAGTFEQSWFYDDPASGGTGLMKATVDYDQIFLLDSAGVATSTTLADYVIAHPVAAGDTWTLSYFDNAGGNYQARTVLFNFFAHDPGDPGIVASGGILADQMYGTSGSDVLDGNGGDDIIVGAGGDDLISGGVGDDELYGGAGLNTMNGGAGGDIFVIDAEALDEINLVDVIVDYTPGEDVIDLSALLASLGSNAPATAAEVDATLDVTFSSGAAHIMVDDNGIASGGTMHEVASLSGIGVGHVISILYDSIQSSHQEAVIA